MAINFKNRVGEDFFIRPKATKTGKTTYSLSKTKDDTCLSELPEGYEVYERYDLNMMFIRKMKDSLFTQKDIQTITTILKKNKSLEDFKLDINGNEMKIFSLDGTGMGKIPRGFM